MKRVRFMGIAFWLGGGAAIYALTLLLEHFGLYGP